MLNVVLNGSTLGAGANGLTLAAGSDGSTIRGLVIGGFNQYGISIESAGNTIAGHFIGINAAGAATFANGHGVYISNVGGNTIGGSSAADRNVISGNNVGVFMWGSSATGNFVQGITSVPIQQVTSAVANTSYGVWLASGATGNTIGGAVSGAGNVISGNSSYGVYLAGASNTAAGTSSVSTQPKRRDR